MTELKCPCGSANLRKSGFTWRRPLLNGKRVAIKVQKWQCAQCGFITAKPVEN